MNYPIRSGVIVQGPLFFWPRLIGKCISGSSHLWTFGVKFISANSTRGPVNYNGIMPELGFRMDILVQNEIIVEVKSVETLHDVPKSSCSLIWS